MAGRYYMSIPAWEIKETAFARTSEKKDESASSCLKKSSLLKQFES